MSRTIRVLPACFALASFIAIAQVPESSYVNFEGAQTNPVRLSPSGSRLFVVNTADARLSVFDISQPSNPVRTTEIPVGLEPVSVNPRTDDEVWVVNQASDSISVVSVSAGIVIDTIYVKDEPADVVFAGDQAFVSVSRSNEIRIFNAKTRRLLKTIPVFGENPRALAVNGSGSKVYAAFALSGNRTTAVSSLFTPPQPAPLNPALPAPPRVALIVDAEDAAWQWYVRFRMPDNDVVEIDTRTQSISRYFTRVGTINLGIAVRPFSEDVYVSNTDARNRIRFEPELRGRFSDNRVTRIRASNGTTLAPFDLNPGTPSLGTALAQPASLVFDPLGRYLFVASFGTDRVAVLNPDTGAVLARVETGSAVGSQIDPRNKRGPRGLAMHRSAPMLYVANRISNTLSVIDTAALRVVSETPVGSFDPTPLSIRNGRGFLYDAKLSGNGTASCAACHVDADMDFLAWDLGNPAGEMQEVIQEGKVLPMHPMKGPMTTQSLRGLTDIGTLHWRGDRLTFADFNPAFASLMGGLPLSLQDMAAFSAFANTIRYQPNPNQNLDRTLPATLNGGSPTAGLFTFLFDAYTQDVKCNTCHESTPGPGTNGFIQNFFGQEQPIKVAHLRNVYQKVNFTPAQGGESIGGFGLLNDGSVANVFVLLSQSNFDRFAGDNLRKINLASYVLCFDTGTAPAVGYSRTVRAAGIEDAAVVSDWALLEGQAALGNIDLIAKGTLVRELHGLIYRPATKDYLSDTGRFPPLTRSQLGLLIRQQGDTLTLMGVAPGTGLRMGIDRDLDGIPDGDER